MRITNHHFRNKNEIRIIGSITNLDEALHFEKRESVTKKHTDRIRQRHNLPNKRKLRVNTQRFENELMAIPNPEREGFIIGARRDSSLEVKKLSEIRGVVVLGV